MFCDTTFVFRYGEYLDIMNFLLLLQNNLQLQYIRLFSIELTFFIVYFLSSIPVVI